MNARRLKLITGAEGSYLQNPWHDAFMDMEAEMRDTIRLVELASLAAEAENSDLAFFAIWKARNATEEFCRKYYALHEAASRGPVSAD